MYTYGPPRYGRAKAGRPARSDIQQLCEDTGCSPEDLLEAMNDRGGVAREGQGIDDDDDDDEKNWHFTLETVTFGSFPSIREKTYQRKVILKKKERLIGWIKRQVEKWVILC